MLDCCLRPWRDMSWPRVLHHRPVCGEGKEGVGAVQDFSCAGMEVHGEGEHDAQGQGFQALPAVCGEHRAGAEAHVGHGHHLRSEGESKWCPE